MGVTGSGHSGPWTVEEVLALPADPGSRIELVGGALLTSPAPDVPQQRAGLRLAMLLSLAADTADAPFEVSEAVRVIVPDGLLVPDLVISDAIAEIETDDGGVLTADRIAVAVEVASPATRVIDKKLKPSLYAAAGIPHYWRLELEPVPRLYLGRLEDGRYVDRLVQVGESTAVVDPFVLDLDPAALLR